MPPLPKTDKAAPSRPPRQQRPPSTSSISSLKLNVNNTGRMSPAASISPPTPNGSVRLTMPVVAPEATSTMAPRPTSARIRSKRMSAGGITPRASPGTRTKGLQSESNNPSDNSHSRGLERPGSAASSFGRSSFERTDRYTGSIADRTDEELTLASREALQNALRKEWADREQFIARIDLQQSLATQAEERAVEKQNALEVLQVKFDNLFNDQSILESELEAVNELVEHLRSNLLESERQTRLGHRRYADQEKAFEAERLVHQAEHQHLQQRVKSLMSERVVRPGNDDSNAALQEELATFTASHQTLVVQLTTLADEIHELKVDNTRLQEENDAWQLLIEDRTLAGAMRGGLFSSPGDVPGDRGPSPTSTNTMRRTDSSVLETLEEQMEMDELNKEMDAHQSFFDDTSDMQGILSVPPKSNGVSLALELNAAPQMAEMEALRSEVKGLKEANRALSLYCSKILDRIIANEGYEHILSADYRTRRLGTRGGPGGKTRPSVEEMAKEMEQNGPPPLPEPVKEPALTAPIISAPLVPSRAPTQVVKPRPQSMMAVSNVSQPLPKPSETKKDSDKERRQSRRGFSIDFRSLGFGAAEPKPEPKPHLKPLQLASRATPANSTVPCGTAGFVSTSPPNHPFPGLSGSGVVARKLEPQEEDEEDRRERHRMEAALKLMGIDRSTPPNESTPLPFDSPVDAVAPNASHTGNWFSRRLSRAATTASASDPTSNSATCSDGDAVGITRNRSSGNASDPILPGFVDLTDEAADAAAVLRVYDEREREQARLISGGRNPTAFTPPPRMSRDRRSANSRPSSTMSTSTKSITDANVVGTEGSHRKVESISTLWSLGSSRASVEFNRDNQTATNE